MDVETDNIQTEAIEVDNKSILIISAHDDPKSFVAAMHNTALGVFERTQKKVTVSDLYAQGFNPVASALDFKIKSNIHANYMFEQQRAVNTGSGFSPDLQAEMDKVKNADIIIIHFPLWWSGPPAILKGWIERVLAMGFAWDANNRYSKGLMKGKKVLLSVSVGDPESYYSTEGMHRATVTQHLYGLVHSTLAFCGFDVIKPHIISNVTAASQDELESKLEEYRLMLQTVESTDNFAYKH
jgi:NAD(P)H dehydrogenase (quinone)